MKKVSIIVPIYNVEKYLRKCLDSLVNQTLEDIEILLINDKSPDNSDKIMKEYEERYQGKIRCFYQTENKKQGAARNVGIVHSTGEYLMFVDSDDWVDLTICEKMYNCAKREDADLIFCDYVQVFENNHKQRYIMDVNEIQTGEITTGKLKSLFPVVAYPFARLTARKLIIENKILFAENIKYEDKVFVPFLPLYAKKMGKVNEGLYFYLQRASSTVNAKNEIFQFDRMIASKISYEEMKERGFYDKYKEEIDFCYYKNYYLMTLRYCIEKFDIPPIDKMRELNDIKNKEFPDYKYNKYIDKLLEPIYLKIAECNEQSTEYLIEKYNTDLEYFKKCSYIPFYEQYKEKVSRLLEQLHQLRKSIAIWGAGPKGLDFLRVCDASNENIDYVIDGDTKKENQKLCTGHVIQTFDVLKEKVDAIIVINRYHFGEIYHTIQKYTKKYDIIDLDNYLVFDLISGVINT